MRIAVISISDKDEIGAISRQVCDYLRDCGADVVTAALAQADDALPDVDAVVALGGDGTMMRLAKRAARYDKPLLGVNCGHLGFMAGIESNELPLLSKLVSGEYEIEPRRLLEVTAVTAEGSRTFAALNEAAVSRGVTTHMAEFTVFKEGETWITYRADGVIVASPTGSTAYSLSAGGPIVDPQVDCLILTPICPHSLTARPFVLSGDAELSISVQPKCEGDTVSLSVDGEEGVELTAGDRVYVRRHEQTARFIRIKSHNFCEILRKKMMNRAE
ncbi:MAG: NAD(+)/NADH kinase [Clostridia bacterium]|nr:NAD(+)/NADH kinase [Clostridia bacterium]